MCEMLSPWLFYVLDVAPVSATRCMDLMTDGRPGRCFRLKQCRRFAPAVDLHTLASSRTTFGGPIQHFDWQESTSVDATLRIDLLSCMATPRG